MLLIVTGNRIWDALCPIVIIIKIKIGIFVLCKLSGSGLTMVWFWEGLVSVTALNFICSLRLQLVLVVLFVCRGWQELSWTRMGQFCFFWRVNSRLKPAVRSFWWWNCLPGRCWKFCEIFQLSSHYLRSFVFELWADETKLLGNMDFATSIAAFVHLCFVFDLSYPKASYWVFEKCFFNLNY